MYFYDLLREILTENPEDKLDILGLEIVYQDEIDQVAEEIKFDWQVKSVSANVIDFQLKFEDALLVSNGEFDKHSVKV